MSEAALGASLIQAVLSPNMIASVPYSDIDRSFEDIISQKWLKKKKHKISLKDFRLKYRENVAPIYAKWVPCLLHQSTALVFKMPYLECKLQTVIFVMGWQVRFPSGDSSMQIMLVLSDAAQDNSALL